MPAEVPLHEGEPGRHCRALDLPWPALAAGHHYRTSINASWPQFALAGDAA